MPVITPELMKDAYYDKNKESDYGRVWLERDMYNTGMKNYTKQFTEGGIGIGRGYVPEYSHTWKWVGAYYPPTNTLILCRYIDIPSTSTSSAKQKVLVKFVLGVGEDKYDLPSLVRACCESVADNIFDRRPKVKPGDKGHFLEKLNADVYSRIRSSVLHIGDS